MGESRRAEALVLAEELLGDIEYHRIGGSDIAKKASRLARLLDDADAMAWLRYEVAGYTPSALGHMPPAEVVTAERSRRVMKIDADTGLKTYNVDSLGEIDANIAAATAALEGLSGAPASGEHALLVENARRDQRYFIWTRLGELRRRADAVLGAIHDYVADRYQELRFGSAVESAFEIVRADVDARVAAVVPTALPRLAAALENTASSNPEHWANAASTCRRLLKEVADALRPPGPDVDGRPMGPDNYINRLVAWINERPASGTLRDLVLSDLEYLGRRIDAVAEAGHKGAHSEVSRRDAARFLVGTYLLLGDILGLRSEDESEAPIVAGIAETSRDDLIDLPAASEPPR